MYESIGDAFPRMFRRESKQATLTFAMGWSFVVTIACAAIGVGALRQLKSTYWPQADGIITISEPGGKRGQSWGLEFTYTVAGRKYTGTQYAYDPMPIQGEAEVLRHVAAYPVGASVIVFYDPMNPAEAVLHPGLRGCTLWVALFLTPFVLVGVGLWVGLLAGKTSRAAFDPTDPRQVTITETGTIFVRPQRSRWLLIFLSYLAVTAFLVSWVLFFIGFGLGVAYWMFKGSLLDPPLAVPASVWAVTLVGCALATWRAIRRAPVFTLDPIREIFQFSSGGLPAVEMPLTTIGDASVTEQTYQRRNGKTVRHRVQLASGTGGAALALGEYDDARDAQAMADWLRQQVCDRSGGGRDADFDKSRVEAVLPVTQGERRDFVADAIAIVEPIPAPLAGKVLTPGYRRRVLAYSAVTISLFVAGPVLMILVVGFGFLSVFLGMACCWASWQLAYASSRSWARSLYRAACREFASRPGLLVDPSDPEALFVEVVLRENWPQMQRMLEHASDVGFLRIDTERRLLLFEGDKERYIVPAESILSCEVEQMQATTYVVFGQTQTRTNPRFAAVLRAQRADGPWEAALAVRYDTHGPCVSVGTSHHSRAQKLKDTILGVRSFDG